MKGTTDSALNPDAVSESDTFAGGRDLACATLGCGARFAMRDRRLGPGGVYCVRCHGVIRAVFRSGDVLVATLASLRELNDLLPFVEPYPAALPCLAYHSRPRPALPATLWCSPACQRRVWSFGHRAFRLVQLGGVVLPERTWRVLRGLGESTYRMRRVEVGAIEALVMPLDIGRSRSARAGIAARRGLPPPGDGIELRDLVRAMTFPKIKSL